MHLICTIISKHNSSHCHILLITPKIFGAQQDVRNRSGDAGRTIKMAGSTGEFVLHYVPKEY